MWVLFPFVSAIGLSYGVTWLVRKYALARQIIDVPNQRSSHQKITARGGGVSIALSFIFLLPALELPVQVRQPLILAMAGGGGLVAAIGFIDDHRHVPVRWRLVIHSAAAAWALFLFAGLTDAGAGALASMPALLLAALAVVGLIWLINLYNFMDGIDGIASIEAITVCLGGALIYYIAEPAAQVWLIPVLLASSVAGFLAWNYPPARIFMGDGGSGFLGFALGVLVILAAAYGYEIFWAWLILLAVFNVDSGVALVRRLLRGQRLTLPHRSHAYQYAARKVGSHKQVSLAVGVINMVWLLPIAVLVALSMLSWILGILIAHLPLIWLAFKYKSGAPEIQEV